MEDYYDTDIRLFPMGLAYLKGTLNHFHPDVEVIMRDYHAGHGRQMVDVVVEVVDVEEGAVS